jgi:hypothetical protein
MVYKINQEVRIMYQKPYGLLRQEKILILLVMVVFILPGNAVQDKLKIGYRC